MSIRDFHVFICNGGTTEPPPLQEFALFGVVEQGFALEGVL